MSAQFRNLTLISFGFICLIAMGACDDTSGCTGPDPDDTQEISGTFIITPTPPLCTPIDCQDDDVGAVFFQGAFDIVNLGDNNADGIDELQGQGTFAFDLYEFRNNDLGPMVCRQQWDFSADFVALDTTIGCDAAGNNCTNICPYDDPDDLAFPVGNCAGHFINISPVPDSYDSDCVFLNPVSWFHPDIDTARDFNEQFLFSSALENIIPTGAATGDTWGDWSAELIGAGGGFEGFAPALQTSFVNDIRDPTTDEFTGWSNAGFLFGATFMDTTVDTDGDGNNDTPTAGGEGNHAMWSPFVLIFQ